MFYLQRNLEVTHILHYIEPIGRQPYTLRGAMIVSTQPSFPYFYYAPTLLPIHISHNHASTAVPARRSATERREVFGASLLLTAPAPP